MHEKPVESDGKISIGQYQFGGPFVDLSDVYEQPGLLALFAEINGRFELLALTEAENLKHNARFASHEVFGKLSIAVLYTPQLSRSERLSLREDILEGLEPIGAGNARETISVT